MCFSSATSFGMAVLLTVGGGLCLRKTLPGDKRFTAMSVMPLAVGVQQFMEGIVWLGIEQGDQTSVPAAALSYLFFVWMFWPTWLALMTYKLEPDPQRQKTLRMMMSFGLLFGALIFGQLFMNVNAVEVNIVGHSISYNLIMPIDLYVPRWAVYLVYLGLVGIPPLLSAHYHLRLFGFSLMLFVPVTFAFYSYAGLSVLCFFAAFATLYLIYIVEKGKVVLE